MFYSVPWTFQQADGQTNKHNIPKNPKVQDRTCTTIAGLPKTYFVLQRNQARYSTLMGLVT